MAGPDRVARKRRVEPRKAAIRRRMLKSFVLKSKGLIERSCSTAAVDVQIGLASYAARGSGWDPAQAPSKLTTLSFTIGWNHNETRFDRPCRSSRALRSSERPCRPLHRRVPTELVPVPPGRPAPRSPEYVLPHHACPETRSVGAGRRGLPPRRGWPGPSPAKTTESGGNGCRCARRSTQVHAASMPCGSSTNFLAAPSSNYLYPCAA